ncbi:CDP-diacylglycerol-glycerol-3-phosphate 3-phosphatidyltransferase, variant [Aphanomyces invadans]|uniref:CDP-diacylglycerol-glycerol-3-phosphate 3-phosphatidyltransferase, variant n=2 Tax=Aphanomyces invadans TaxID=157072 RepID=A0A024UU30_9STRA|nr:CDP-diacylglycerol-glycerol-3-phosphate 3-phosphatidyltransferase, variant [Aphanomyces invadans]ETW09178.1 CDP-diacylglycerol-glycerol-3-phosphate 3-phosphatidyltransferase, variant [Aphanomyces invadans]|eukprot:XP_008862983.1 CDP-diacylglycerol-glycerol-3-phosphate 3-phosphatidyltransferase, variant [Aphanomyces invadans]
MFAASFGAIGRAVPRSHWRHTTATMDMSLRVRHMHTKKQVDEPAATSIKNDRPSNDKMLQILTLPNVITMTRIVATPYLGHLIMQGEYKYAVGVLAVASISDWLDGYLARKLDQKTVVGTFLDPLADKLMVGTLCLSLGYVQLLPLPLVVVIFGRDLLLIGGTLLYRHRTRNASSDFFQTNNAFEVQPTLTSKINTALQFTTLGGALLHAASPVPGSDVALQCLLYVPSAIASSCTISIHFMVLARA